MKKLFMVLWLITLSAIGYPPAAAFAATIQIADGLLTVHQGDTLVSSKPLSEKLTSAGTYVHAANQPWTARIDRGSFTLSGNATTLKVIGYLTGGYDKTNPYKYQVMDGTPVAVPQLVGANLAGCYAAPGGALCPNTGEIDAYVAAHVGDIFRFAIKDDTPFDKLTAAIDHALALGKTVIIDRHDYAWHSAADNLAYWQAKLGAKYIGNPRVMIELDNEPRGFNSVTIPNDFMEWAAGTRDTEALFLANGITNPVLTEWPQSSAIFRFDKNEAATKDCESAGCAIDRTPGFPITGNVILAPHQYLDHGSSGSNAACDPYSWTAMVAPQIRKRHLTAIITEQAWGRYSGVPATCVTPGAATLAGIRANPDVFLGFTQWGGGRDWKCDYLFVMGGKCSSLDNAYVHSLPAN